MQLDVTSVPLATCFWMAGRQLDRQRPGAPLPGNGSHESGMKLSAVEMSGPASAFDKFHSHLLLR